jgi:hypothetical protein
VVLFQEVEKIMSTESVFLSRARDKANLAFDEHCDHWDRLNNIADPTMDDVEDWLVVREAFFAAQEKFENILSQIAKPF